LRGGNRNLFYAMLLPLSTLAIVFGGARRRIPIHGTRLALFSIAIVLVGSAVACGGGGSSGTPGGGGQPGTPAGTYTVMVSATSGSAAPAPIPVTLTVQ
jgi:hypothetical protein